MVRVRLRDPLADIENDWNTCTKHKIECTIGAPSNIRVYTTATSGPKRGESKEICNHNPTLIPEATVL